MKKIIILSLIILITSSFISVAQEENPQPEDNFDWDSVDWNNPDDIGSAIEYDEQLALEKNAPAVINHLNDGVVWTGEKKPEGIEIDGNILRNKLGPAIDITDLQNAEIEPNGENGFIIRVDKDGIKEDIEISGVAPEVSDTDTIEYDKETNNLVVHSNIDGNPATLKIKGGVTKLTLDVNGEYSLVYNGKEVTIAPDKENVVYVNSEQILAGKGTEVRLKDQDKWISVKGTDSFTTKTRGNGYQIQGKFKSSFDTDIGTVIVPAVDFGKGDYTLDINTGKLEPLNEKDITVIQDQLGKTTIKGQGKISLVVQDENGANSITNQLETQKFKVEDGKFEITQKPDPNIIRDSIAEDIYNKYDKLENQLITIQEKIDEIESKHQLTQLDKLKLDSYKGSKKMAEERVEEILEDGKNQGGRSMIPIIDEKGNPIAFFKAEDLDKRPVVAASIVNIEDYSGVGSLISYEDGKYSINYKQGKLLQPNANTMQNNINYEIDIPDQKQRASTLNGWKIEQGSIYEVKNGEIDDKINPISNSHVEIETAPNSLKMNFVSEANPLKKFFANLVVLDEGKYEALVINSDGESGNIVTVATGDIPDYKEFSKKAAEQIQYFEATMNEQEIEIFDQMQSMGLSEKSIGTLKSGVESSIGDLTENPKFWEMEKLKKVENKIVSNPDGSSTVLLAAVIDTKDQHDYELKAAEINIPNVNIKAEIDKSLERINSNQNPNYDTLTTLLNTLIPQ